MLIPVGQTKAIAHKSYIKVHRLRHALVVYVVELILDICKFILTRDRPIANKHCQLLFVIS